MTHSIPFRFEIRIRGVLAEHWATRFDGATLRLLEGGDTALDGRVSDQSAFFGILRTIEALGLEVVSLKARPEGQE